MIGELSDTWYKDFFKGINCELWERAVSPEWTKQEVDFLISQLAIKPGQHLLDIPCGFGRHSIELAKRGYRLTGIDISETFIDKLNEKVAAENLTVETILGDMLTVKIDKLYAGAICMGNSFGYFDFDKMKLFIEKVALSLETGAGFIVNSGMVAESILPNFAKNKSYTLGDLRMDITNTYLAESSCMVSNLLYTQNEHTETHVFKHYVFTLAEIKRLLLLSGLETTAVYSSPAAEPFRLGDQQIYIVARKR